jgi:hypothetical protein
MPRVICTTWAFDARSNAALLEELDLLLEIYSVMGGSFLSAVLNETLPGEQYPATSVYATAVGSTLRTPACLGGACADEVAVSRGGFRSSANAWYQSTSQGRGYPDIALLASDGDAARALGDFAARLPEGVALGLLNPLLYRGAEEAPLLYRDIVACTPGASCAQGWDEASGLGALDLASFDEYLASHLSPSAPRIPLCSVSAGNVSCACYSNAAKQHVCQDACGNCPRHLPCYMLFHFGCTCSSAKELDCLHLGGQFCRRSTCAPGEGCLSLSGGCHNSTLPKGLHIRAIDVLDYLGLSLILLALLLILFVSLRRPLRDGYVRARELLSVE